MKQLTQIKTNIDNEVAKYKKAVDKIKSSDNPKYSDKAIVDYEVKQLKESLDETVADLKAQHDDKAAELLAQARETASKTVLRCADHDKEIVDNHVESFQSDVVFAANANQRQEAIAKLEQHFYYMSPSQLDYARKQLAKVAGSVKDKDTLKQLRGINRTLSQVGTDEQMYADELADYLEANTVDRSYRLMNLVKQRKA